jgi:DNA-binding beta-propeller fold protein YncE
MMSVTSRRLAHRWVAVLVAVGTGPVYLISGSAARADIVSGTLSPAGVAVNESGDVFIADTGNNRVLLEKPNGSGGYTQSVVATAGLSAPQGVAVDGSRGRVHRRHRP